MSIISDDWNEYIYEVRANKVGGVEGFLILFRCLGLLQDRGLVLADHLNRMERETTRLEHDSRRPETNPINLQ